MLSGNVYMPPSVHLLSFELEIDSKRKENSSNTHHGAGKVCRAPITPVKITVIEIHSSLETQLKIELSASVGMPPPPKDHGATHRGCKNREWCSAVYCVTGNGAARCTV